MDIFLGALFIIICVLLIIVVLLQKGRGGGLGAAFGGAGSAAFGTRTGDVFTWVTIVLTGLFLLLAVGTSLYMRPKMVSLQTPQITPASQEISEPTLVTIRFNPGDRKNAKVYYTTDGTEPRQNAAGSKEYTQPFKVQPDTTVKARAFAPGAKDSTVATATYGSKPQAATQPGEGATTRSATGPASRGAASAPANMKKQPATGLESRMPATVGG